MGDGGLGTDDRLKGKVALVTGAARGFGWGIARALGRAGARVCISDLNEAELARAENDVRGDGAAVLSRALDVADRAAFERVVGDVVRAWGRLDVLVHSAIYMPLVRFDALTDEGWQRQMSVSLGGLYNGTRAVWAHMKAQGGGHIIGIASGSSVRGYVDEVAYCTAKHAQEGFVKALAMEAKGFNIAVNTIGPGAPIKTTRLTWAELDALPEAERANWADPVELGQAFVWLASQPPTQFSGFRFDAGPIVTTMTREGFDFEFAPEKVTLYVEDFVARAKWYESKT